MAAMAVLAVATIRPVAPYQVLPIPDRPVQLDEVIFTKQAMITLQDMAVFNGINV